MGKKWKYMSLSKIAHMRNNGRELLGRYIYFTEKRDGSCLTVWLKLLPKWKQFLYRILHKQSVYQIMVSSRKQKMAEKDIKGDFNRCEDCPSVIVYLNDNPTHIVFGELLRLGLSPTRIENHKKVEFIVFDIFDGTNFLNFQQVHQICYHYNIRCVELFGEGRFRSMKSLLAYKKQMLKLCKALNREGVVLKAFTRDNKPLYAKEKLDTATSRGKPKLERGKPEYPPLPFSEAIGAVDKAYADLGAESFSEKRLAMPLVSRYIKEEMTKHLCSKPEMNYYNLYRLYCKDHNIEVK